MSKFLAGGGTPLIPPVGKNLRPTVCLIFLLEYHHWISLNFGMVLETVMKLCLAEPEFLEKLFLLQKLGKVSKIWFFEFEEKFGL